MARAIVLVEGPSDRVALETLAARQNQDLKAQGVTILSMGGAHAIGGVLERLAREQPQATLAGLYDAGEEEVVGRSLRAAGYARAITRRDLERLGFFVCVEDLEDELIRAAGSAAVEALLADQGELAGFRTLQKEPAWRGRPVGAQLRRFLGNAQRKIRYARLLVEVLDQSRIPRPLLAVLARVTPQP